MRGAPVSGEARRTRPVPALRRLTGQLSTAAMSRMDERMPWLAELSAQERSWIGSVLQAAIKNFVDWYQSGAEEAPEGSPLASSIFGAAPRDFAGVISLRQTVDLVRLSIEAIETQIDDLLPPEDAREVHQAVLRYGREVAFATAEVYARAAEQRGAWDARLEALVVDAVLRSEADDSVLSRASALAWTDRGEVAVVVGAAPAERGGGDLFEDVRRSARAAGLDALCAVQGERLVVVLGGVDDELSAAQRVEEHFGPGPVVAGPRVGDLHAAPASARAALAAHRAAPGWPSAPRPVRSRDLLVERLLGGDERARDHLVEEVYRVLAERPALVDTLTAYTDAGGSLEGAARVLFVHPNTVRYRLRQVLDATGLAPTSPRDALTLRVALTLGRQADAHSPVL